MDEASGASEMYREFEEMGYVEIDAFENELCDEFVAFYDPNNEIGWFGGTEFGDEYFWIYEGFLEQPDILLAEEESIWLENWWYRVTGKRLVTPRSMLSTMTFGGTEDPKAFVSPLQNLMNKTLPEGIKIKRPGVGGRRRKDRHTPEEGRIMKAYDAGTKPAEISRILDIPKETVTKVIDRIKKLRKRQSQQEESLLSAIKRKS